MTIKTIDEHAYEIVTEEGAFAVCKDTLAKFDATKHEHGVAACGRCGCCFTGDCCDDTGCEHNHTDECGGQGLPARLPREPRRPRVRLLPPCLRHQREVPR